MIRITTDAEILDRMRDALKSKQAAKAILKALPRMSERQREDLQALDYDIYHLACDIKQIEALGY
jgi:hypothetical protein